MVTASPPVNSQTNVTKQDIANQKMPPEGPRCIPLGFNFATAASFNMNLVNFQSRGYVTIIQGAWIDNSANTNPVIVSNYATGQNVICPPYWQGYFAILAVQPVDLYISSTIANVNVNVTLYNVPIAPNAWPAAGPGSQGTIPVSDSILDATVIGGHVSTIGFVYGSSDVIRPKFKADILVSSRVTTAATTTLLTGAPGFFIDWVDIRISGVATLAVAGITNVSLVDGSTVLMQADIYIPAAALNSSEIIVFDIPPGMNWRSAGTTTALKLVLSTALNAGSIIANLGACVTAQ